MDDVQGHQAKGITVRQNHWSLAAAMPTWGGRALALGRVAGQVGEAAAVRSTWGGELSLSEMLADPIVQILMARDNVTTDQVKDLIAAVQGKLSGRQAEDRQPNRPQSRGAVHGA